MIIVNAQRGLLQGIRIITCSKHVAIELLLHLKAQDIEGILGVLKLFIVINGVNLYFSLRDEEVVIGISTEAAHLLQSFNRPLLNQLEEDMVAPLIWLLVGNTGLFKQVDINEATSQLTHVVEVDTDKLTLNRYIIKLIFLKKKNLCKFYVCFM